jgi:hypothetical protein
MVEEIKEGESDAREKKVNNQRARRLSLSDRA